MTPRNNDSLWGYDYSEDRLELLLRTGGEISLDGAPHVLTSFDVRLGSGGQDGLPTAYNDSGQIALIVELEPAEGGPGVVAAGAAPSNMPVRSARTAGLAVAPDAGTGGADGGTGGTDSGGAGGGGGGGGSGGCSAAGTDRNTVWWWLGAAIGIGISVRRRRAP